MLKGAVYAVIPYLAYAISAGMLGYFALLPILFIYSPLTGLFSFSHANSTRSLKQAFSLLGVVLVVFDTLMLADSLVRGNTIGIGLVEYLPPLAASMSLFVPAGLLWTGTSFINTRLRIKSLLLSRVLSIMLVLSGTFLWYYGVLIPFFRRFSE